MGPCGPRVHMGPRVPRAHMRPIRKLVWRGKGPQDLGPGTNPKPCGPHPSEQGSLGQAPKGGTQGPGAPGNSGLIGSKNHDFSISWLHDEKYNRSCFTHPNPKMGAVGGSGRAGPKAVTRSWQIVCLTGFGEFEGAALQLFELWLQATGGQVVRTAGAVLYEQPAPQRGAASVARRNQKEPGGARRSLGEPGGAMGSQVEPVGARRSQEEPGGARRSQEEPGRARGSQEKPGGARRSQEEPGGARRSQGEPGGARRSQEKPGGARRSQEEPGGARGGFTIPRAGRH